MVFESRVRAKNILNQQNVEICKIKNTSLDKYVYIGNSCIPYIKALDSKTLNKVMANIFSFHLKILYFKKLIFRQKNPYKRILNIFTSLLLIIINGPCIKNIPWSMPPPPQKNAPSFGNIFESRVFTFSGIPYNVYRYLRRT